MNDIFLCPCGSTKNYELCCEPIIHQKKLATTAESLMRARYSAYVMHEIQFITDSCLADNTSVAIDMQETERWSKESTWEGLQILGVEKGQETDSEGIVEFKATYSRGGLKDVHQEKASFIKSKGKWLYKDGIVKPLTVVRTAKKVGRNEPCPCGSGKKYKQCCGR